MQSNKYRAFVLSWMINQKNMKIKDFYFNNIIKIEKIKSVCIIIDEKSKKN